MLVGVPPLVQEVLQLPVKVLPHDSLDFLVPVAPSMLHLLLDFALLLLGRLHHLVVGVGVLIDHVHRLHDHHLLSVALPSVEGHSQLPIHQLGQETLEVVAGSTKIIQTITLKGNP